MKKLILLTLSIIVLATACTWVLKNENLSSKQTIVLDEQGEENEFPKHLRVKARSEMEHTITQDPNLGYVPRERLMEAKTYTDKLREESIDFRGPISNITWTNRGPKKVAGRTRAILFDPNDATNKTIFAGGVSGGIWKNTDITNPATSWTKITNGDMLDNLAITALAADPNTPMTMYAATGEAYTGAVQGVGVFKSVDGGNTWAYLSTTSDYKYITDLIVRNESGTSVIYMGSDEDGVSEVGNPANAFAGKDGLYRSADGGTTWTQVLPLHPTGNQPYEVDDVDLGADGKLWASTGPNAFGHTGGAIFHCTTGCETSTNWTKAHPEDNSARVVLATSPSVANTIYAVAGISGGNTDCNWIKKSIDGGATWTSLGIPPNKGQDCSESDHFTRGQATYDLDMAVHPTDPDVVVIGGINVLRSTNGGTSFSYVSYWTSNGCSLPEVHADIHKFVFRPGNTNELLVGHDGGVSYSANAGDKNTATPTFAHHNEDYNVTQFYACDIHPTAGMNKWIAGAQDNGTQYWNNVASSITNEVVGGDGAFCHIDQDNPLIQIGAYIYGDITITKDEWATNANIIVGSNIGRFINPTDYDDANNILYGAGETDKILRVQNIGNTNMPQEQIAASLGGKIATTVKVDPNDPTTIYAGTDGGKIYKITGANMSPSFGSVTDISGNMSSADKWFMTSIDVQVGNSMHLLVTFGNYGVGSVWESIDGGANWTNVEGNIPDMPVRGGIFSPENGDHALVATELGVWSTDNLNGGTTNWGATNGGLAHVRVDMLKWRTSDKFMVAGTYGRGLYTAKIGGALATELVSFEAKGIEDAIQLDWVTGTEKDHLGFDILRSDSETNDFKKIAWVAGKGNTSSNSSYQFKDENIRPNQTYYYQLRMVDTHQKEDFSKVVTASVKEEIAEEISLYPNPAIHKITIKVPAWGQQTIVRLFSLTGQLIRTQIIDTNTSSTMTFNIADLAEGTYIVQVRNGQQSITKQLLIAR